MGSSFSIPISNESTQSEGQTAQLGIGVSAFLIAGVSAEIGLCYSDQAGLDLYLTGGIGYGVGVSTKVTGNYNVVSSTDLNFSTGQTATMGMGLAATYDMKARQFTGVSGLGAGGGVLYTGTVTLKGLWRTVFGK